MTRTQAPAIQDWFHSLRELNLKTSHYLTGNPSGISNKKVLICSYLGVIWSCIKGIPGGFAGLPAKNGKNG
jgi:hypothetical protein